MRIPFGTIEITDKSKALINRCLDENRVSCGRLVGQFESRFAELMAAPEAVAVSSGTDALILALAALYDMGVRRGDEVIVPALSYVATGAAVVHAGLTPVFVDVDPVTMNIDPAAIEAKLSPETRAILPVHLMGKPAPMDDILSVARSKELFVVEDAAEAFGALYKGRRVGTIGDFGCFSLYVAHVITSIEGGMILTRTAEHAEILRSLRGHGRACKCKTCVSNVNSGYCEKRFADKNIGDIRFHFERVGYSSKMNELEAAVGLGNLDLYDEIVAKRHGHLMQMIEGFKAFDHVLWTYDQQPHERIGPHAFPFVVRPDAPFSRDDLLVHLEHQGVDARTLFSSIPTQCGGFEYLGYQPGDFPHAENIGRNGIHIGVHQDITDDDISWFIALVADYIKQHQA